VAGAGIAGFLHPVVAVPGAPDDAGQGPVPALRVQILAPGYAGHDCGEDAFLLPGGKAAGSATQRRAIRTVLLNLTRSGSMPASGAARQIRADRAQRVSR
jgi:hypothetical protein